MSLHYRTMKPPAALRKASIKFDNIAIVPASLLLAPHQAEYKKAANRLPTGSVLICTPRQSQKQQRITASITSYFQGHGHQVTTIPIETMINRQAVL
jgi:hypothetical protein